jgi:hypothetical protein
MSTVPPATPTVGAFRHVLFARQPISQLVFALHSTPAMHALSPFPALTPHSMLHLSALQRTGLFLQALSPTQCTAHVPASHSTPAMHAPSLVQVMPQACPLHVTLLLAHAPLPSQTTLHAVAFPHATPALHALPPMHWTAHGMPGGQTTRSFAHRVPSTHEMTHQPPSQVPASPHAALQLSGEASIPPAPGTAGGGGGVTVPESPASVMTAPPSGAIASGSTSVPTMESPHAIAPIATKARTMTMRTRTRTMIA